MNNKNETSTLDVKSKIDRFCEVLWLEDGLSQNTTDSYKRDILDFHYWLKQKKINKNLLLVDEETIGIYFTEIFANISASTANRRLSSFRRFFTWLIRKHSIAQDKDGLSKWTSYNRKLAAAGIFVFAFTTTTAAIDGMKALEYQWFSTMYGVYYFAGAFWRTKPS